MITIYRPWHYTKMIFAGIVAIEVVFSGLIVAAIVFFTGLEFVGYDLADGGDSGTSGGSMLDFWYLGVVLMLVSGGPIVIARLIESDSSSSRGPVSWIDTASFVGVAVANAALASASLIALVWGGGPNGYILTAWVFGFAAAAACAALADRLRRRRSPRFEGA